MDNLIVVVADRLRTLRMLRGLTQEELAEKAGLSVSSIGNFERGVHSPSLETLQGLLMVMKISVEDFFSSNFPGLII